MCQNTGLAAAQARSEARLGMSMTPSTLVKQGVIAAVARSTAVTRAFFIFVSSSRLNFVLLPSLALAPGSNALLRFLFQLFAEVFGAVDGFAGAEVFHLEELADFDFGFPAGLQVGLEGNALGPLDGLFLRLDLNDPVTRDQLFGFGERAVGYVALPIRELYSGALGAGLQAGEVQKDAGFQQLFVVLAHRGEKLFAGQVAGFRIFGGLDNHHESHAYLLNPVTVPSRVPDAALVSAFI